MQNKPYRKYIMFIGACLLASSLSFNALAKDNKNTKKASNKTTSSQTVATKTTQQFDDELTVDESSAIENIPIDEIQKFIQVFQIVQNNYVAQISDEELFDNAMHGLVEQLDPYSHYLDDQQYKQLINFTEGQVAEPDFKVKWNKKSRTWQIEKLSFSSESYKLGLRNDMVVERINGVNIQTLDQRNINNLMIGTQGSLLKIRVRVKQQQRNFEVFRNEKINYDVKAHLLANQILVLRIQAFQQNTVTQVEQILKRYPQIRGVIFDIRDNPGGLLSSAVDLADLFLEQGLIVSTQSRIESTQRFQALPSEQPITYPIAIIQSRFSASASEVFTAAMKQHKRAVIYGENSYGKGAVQKIFPLERGAIQLTVSHYITPNGTMIEGKGIAPDEELALTEMSDDEVWQKVWVSFENYIKNNKISNK